MKRVLLSIALGTFLISGRPALAQEKGPLMMNIQFSVTLMGMLGGAGAGFVVWLLDPGGPVPITENMKNGAVLGTVLGSAGGFFLLYNSAVTPAPPPTIDELLGNRGFSPFDADSYRLEAQRHQPTPENGVVFEYQF